jgi:hypothetical protein
MAAQSVDIRSVSKNADGSLRLVVESAVDIKFVNNEATLVIGEKQHTLLLTDEGEVTVAGCKSITQSIPNTERLVGREAERALSTVLREDHEVTQVGQNLVITPKPERTSYANERKSDH